MTFDQILTDYELVVSLRPKVSSPPPGPGPSLPPSLAVVDWTTYQTPDLTLPLPTDSPWRLRADNLPAHPQSAAFIARLKTLGTTHMHPMFGQGSNGIPVQVVPADRFTPVTFGEGASQSDAGPYPLPPQVIVEANADAHWIGYLDGGALWEIFQLSKGALWSAYSGAIWDVTRNQRRPDGWTSADAAGLPILPGQARYQEVAAGAIGHKLRGFVPRTRHAFLPPASHYASILTDTDLLPMGAVLRLRADYDLSAIKPQARVVAQCLKDYGVFVADNGFAGMGGCPDSRWDDSDLGTGKSIPIDAFEVVAWDDTQLVTQA